MLLEAKEFDVGGKEGWIVKPSDYYSHWAQANRFQINDTLRKYNFLFSFFFVLTLWFPRKGIYCNLEFSHEPTYVQECFV
jgi:hypothetical protein